MPLENGYEGSCLGAAYAARMRRGLTAGQLGDLLEQPITATLATYQPDGTVRLSPVWFEWRDGCFNVVVGAEGVVARHVRNDPRVSLTVHESRPPWRGVEIRATAAITAEGALEGDRRMAARYLGAEHAEAFTAGDPGGQVLLRLEPGEWRAWDFADDPLL